MSRALTGSWWSIALIIGALLTAPAVRAGADGPDYFKIRGVAVGDVLNIRAAPNTGAKRIGSIPPGASCVRNLGCNGGLTYQEATTLAPQQRRQLLRQRPRWCHVEYRGQRGWVAGRYLSEGDCAVAPLPASAGSPAIDTK
jgi:uncharacterized protein YraI